jgi:hypothetical protein
MTRLRAFTLHLIVSVVVFLALLGIMRLVWYPAPYFEIGGGWKVLRVLAGVHLVLGPLLTLILFKPGKAGLKFDMACVILLQLAALSYGGMLVYQQRPAFLVFGVDRFTTVPVADVEFDKLKYSELRRRGGIGPILAQIRPPEDPKARQELMFDVVLGGQKDLEFRAEFYEPYQPDLARLRVRSVALDPIAALDRDARAAIDAFIARQGGRLEDYLYLPLRGRDQDMMMVLSAADGMPAGFIPISPWLDDYRETR